jgi:methionyl-tRNA synthetase
LHPIIPDSTNKALDILGIKKEDRVIGKIANLKFLKSGSIIKKANILFKKIENDN